MGYTGDTVCAVCNYGIAKGQYIYTITATAGTGGTINPDGSTTVYEGGSKTYTITADSDYEISDVQVDGISKGSVSSYVFENVSASHTLVASFEKATTNGTADTDTTDANLPQTGDESRLSPKERA